MSNPIIRLLFQSTHPQFYRCHALVGDSVVAQCSNYGATSRLLTLLTQNACAAPQTRVKRDGLFIHLVHSHGMQFNRKTPQARAKPCFDHIIGQIGQSRMRTMSSISCRNDRKIWDGCAVQEKVCPVGRLREHRKMGRSDNINRIATEASEGLQASEPIRRPGHLLFLKIPVFFSCRGNCYRRRWPRVLPSPETE